MAAIEQPSNLFFNQKQDRILPLANDQPGGAVWGKGLRDVMGVV